MVDEYAPAQLTERKGQETGGRPAPPSRRRSWAAGSGIRRVNDLPAFRSVSCDGCGTDLDEDGACPCCEGARRT